MATKPPIDYVPALCKPGKKCCYAVSASMTVAQSASVSEPQPQKFRAQFCVTSNGADTGQFKAIFSKEEENIELGDIIDDDSPTGIDLIKELVEDVERDRMKQAPEVYDRVE